MKRKCLTCGSKITKKNNGLYLQEQMYSSCELTRLQERRKGKNGVCLSCKETMLFANILPVTTRISSSV